jgi:hypothetical protein
MSTLSWRKVNHSARNGWKAWATDLDPDAPMPTYYRIIQLRPNFPERRVELVNCKTCGGDVIPVGTVSCFDTAKAKAQADYAKRLARQSRKLDKSS